MEAVWGGRAEALKDMRIGVYELQRIDGMMLTWDVNRGRHLSYQRGKRNTNPGTSLIQIEGVENTEAAKYVGQPICKMGRY